MVVPVKRGRLALSVLLVLGLVALGLSGRASAQTEQTPAPAARFQVEMLPEVHRLAGRPVAVVAATDPGTGAVSLRWKGGVSEVAPEIVEAIHLFRFLPIATRLSGGEPELQQQVARLGGSVETRFLEDDAYLTVEAPADRLDAAVAVLEDWLRDMKQGRFDIEAVQAVAADWCRALEPSQWNLAGREHLRATDADHPYRPLFEADCDRIPTLAPDATKRWLNEVMARPHAAIVFVGPWEQPRAAELADRLLAALPPASGGPVRSAAAGQPNRSLSARHSRIAGGRADVRSTHVSVKIALPGVDWDDHVRLRLVTQIGPLGRVAFELREESACAYNISAVLLPHRLDPHLLFSTEFDTDRTAECLGILKAALASLRSEPPTAFETAFAAEIDLGTHADSARSPKDLAAILGEGLIRHWPADPLRESARRLMRMSAEELTALAAHVGDPANWSIVIVDPPRQP